MTAHAMAPLPTNPFFPAVVPAEQAREPPVICNKSPFLRCSHLPRAPAQLAARKPQRLLISSLPRDADDSRGDSRCHKAIMKMTYLLLVSLCLMLSGSLNCVASRSLLDENPALAFLDEAASEGPLLESFSVADPTPTPTPPPSTPAPPYCTANVQPGTVWSNYDGTYMSVINLYLVNGGTQDIETGWTFSIGNPDYLSVFQTWNWNTEGAMDSAGTAYGYANQFWETMLAYGKNTVNIGAIFKGNGPQNFYPRTITINGQPCHIQQMR